MSKTYIVSRNGGTVSKAPVNDNKIPIYANETALDADLANIPDNTLVATKGGHDDVIDQMKEYIREQNVLSDWENITLPTTSGTAIVMQWDGFYYGSSGQAPSLFINGVEFLIVNFAHSNGAGAITIPFKKGDIVYRTDTVLSEMVCYYKLRDYKGR